MRTALGDRLRRAEPRPGRRGRAGPPAPRGRPKTPYPDHRAPSAAACRAAVRALSAMHGPVARPEAQALHGARASCGEVPQVLEALVATILSQNTTQKNSTAAMANLMATFDGSFKAMLDRGPSAIAEAIRQGGLANVKARVIHHLLTEIMAQHGALSLEHLRALPDADAHAALVAFPGVGAKTASCVLLFCLGRDSFAVDTHVWRISRRLGWVPPQASRDQAYWHLDVRVPEDVKYPLHVLLVTHGKHCPECAANGRPQRAPLGPCPLSSPVRGARRRAGTAARSRAERPPTR